MLCFSESWETNYNSSCEISIDGHEVRDLNQKDLRELRRSKVAMVFQHFGLFPHRNVIENISYGLEVRGVGKLDRTKRALRMLMEAYPNQWNWWNGLQQERARLILPLAWLAPDISTAILEGRQPLHLTAKTLRALPELPLDWAEQQRILGFA